MAENSTDPGDPPINIFSIFYFHPDHLGSSTVLTEASGNAYQLFLNLPFGETMAEQRRSSFETPYKFNGKELDANTGLYYYGARYYDPRVSNWLSVDPLASYDPINNSEHYIDGQHNGGVFNAMNLNVYGYTYQNPLRYIDPNGKQVDVVINSEDESVFHNGGQKYQKVNNSFQVLGHGAPQFMLDQRNGYKKIDGPVTFNESFKNNKEWQAGKTRKGFSLILYACNVGRGKNSLGQRMSKYYSNINILAPTRQIWTNELSGYRGLYGKKVIGVDKNGKNIYGRNLDDPGYWILYQDNKAVKAYDATWEPGTPTKGHEVDLKNIPSSHYEGKIGEKDYSKDKFKKDE